MSEPKLLVVAAGCNFHGNGIDFVRTFVKDMMVPEDKARHSICQLSVDAYLQGYDTPVMRVSFSDVPVSVQDLTSPDSSSDASAIGHMLRSLPNGKPKPERVAEKALDIVQMAAGGIASLPMQNILEELVVKESMHQTVVLIGRDLGSWNPNSNSMRGLCDKVRYAKNKFVFINLDLRNRQDVASIYNQTAEQLGGLHLPGSPLKIGHHSELFSRLISNIVYKDPDNLLKLAAENQGSLRDVSVRAMQMCKNIL